jgi:hypothetical protein
VQLAAWFGDVAARSEHHLTVTGSESDLTLRDDRVLVFPGVQVRRDQRADRERMLHDGHGITGVLASQLEHDPDRAQVTFPALTGSNDGQGWRSDALLPGR